MKHYTEFQSLGGFLKHLRVELELTQRGLGAILLPGSTNADKTWSKIENDIQRLKQSQVPLLAQALKLDAEELSKAIRHFKEPRHLSTLPTDSGLDLRPILKELGASSHPVTAMKLIEAIEHWVALKRLVE